MGKNAKGPSEPARRPCLDILVRCKVRLLEQRASGYDEGLIGAVEVFRNMHPAFADRSIPGYLDPVPQVPALVERGRQRLTKFFETFDRQLEANEFVVGDRISVADITVLCSIDFAAKLAKVPMPDEYRHLHRWYAMMSARPSAGT